MVCRAKKRRAKKLILKSSNTKKTHDLCLPYLEITQMIGDSNKTVKDCYANNLGFCAGNISREHYISKAILEKFVYVNSNGIPWIPGENKKLSADALTTKCLCRFHNAYLAPLDDFSEKFFTQALNFLSEDSTATIIYGPALERYILKILYGMLGTGRLKNKKGEILTASDLDIKWLHCLFGLQSFPKGTGLYVNFQEGTIITIEKKMDVSILEIDDRIGGIRISICGIEFYLSLVPKEVGFSSENSNFKNILYRPNKLANTSNKSEIIFFWD
ncbi:MAG: hypothetical protein M9962_03275 [Oligoflexia bacterium]|nr:hypothetical protein [Oligoflexia bacterium]